MSIFRVGTKEISKAPWRGPAVCSLDERGRCCVYSCVSCMRWQLWKHFNEYLRPSVWLIWLVLSVVGVVCLHVSQYISICRPIFKPLDCDGRCICSYRRSAFSSGNTSVSIGVLLCGYSDSCCARQVSGHPRNNVQLGGSFLTVERLLNTTDTWEVIATDASWETRWVLMDS